MNVKKLTVNKRNVTNGCVQGETKHQVLHSSVAVNFSAIQSENDVVLISTWLWLGRHSYHTLGRGL